jgi:hypothetical protein
VRGRGSPWSPPSAPGCSTRAWCSRPTPCC